MEDQAPVTTISTQDAVDDVFLVLYTFEMFVKILGLSFILMVKSYLRDLWHILDYIIVVSSYL